jgi:hypothetical protein
MNVCSVLETECLSILSRGLLHCASSKMLDQSLNKSLPKITEFAIDLVRVKANGKVPLPGHLQHNPPLGGRLMGSIIHI